MEDRQCYELVDARSERILDTAMMSESEAWSANGKFQEQERFNLHWERTK